MALNFNYLIIIIIIISIYLFICFYLFKFIHKRSSKYKLSPTNEFSSINKFLFKNEISSNSNPNSFNHQIVQTLTSFHKISTLQKNVLIKRFLWLRHLLTSESTRPGLLLIWFYVAVTTSVWPREEIMLKSKTDSNQSYWVKLVCKPFLGLDDYHIQSLTRGANRIYNSSLMSTIAPHWYFLHCIHNCCILQERTKIQSTAQNNKKWTKLSLHPTASLPCALC